MCGAEANHWYPAATSGGTAKTSTSPVSRFACSSVRSSGTARKPNSEKRRSDSSSPLEVYSFIARTSSAVRNSLTAKK